MNKVKLNIAMFQPDIAQNTGAVMRLCACLGVDLDIIEPCGFILDDEKLRRVAMDYIDIVKYRRHLSWQHFLDYYKGRRLVLLSTKASDDYLDFKFAPNDILILGRESAGVPEEVAEVCDSKVKVDMINGVRSLNVAMTAAIITSEAVRQIKLQL